MENKYLAGLFMENLKLFLKARIIGFDYLLNPETNELHKVQSNFLSSHNLHRANLKKFIGITNIGFFKIEDLFSGTPYNVWDLQTGDLIGTFNLNKCKHCFGG